MKIKEREKKMIDFEGIICSSEKRERALDWMNRDEWHKMMWHECVCIQYWFRYCSINSSTHLKSLRIIEKKFNSFFSLQYGNCFSHLCMNRQIFYCESKNFNVWIDTYVRRQIKIYSSHNFPLSYHVHNKSQSKIERWYIFPTQ